jgi:membrane associated rhomboid family serine protease
VLRKTVAERLANEIWRLARQDGDSQGAVCAICRKPMAAVLLRTRQGSPKELDVCKSCHFVWFDTRELEQLPSAESQASRREPLPQEARERIAMMELKLLEEKQRGPEFGNTEPDEAWKWIPAILGLPVEMEVEPIRSWPWLTWGLVAAMACTFALTIGNLSDVVQQYGLVPAQLGRYGGITFLTSFFLHGGFFHLLGNAYFLLIFGDNVEDVLGRWRYVLLIAAAALVGDLLHIVGEPHSAVPCIGASGGISGVIAFYALRFPNARLGFVWRYVFLFRWIYMPAWAAMGLWLLLQGVLVVGQLMGVGHVSALAHLGGCDVGLVVWFVWRARDAAAEKDGDTGGTARLPDFPSRVKGFHE